VPWLVIALKDCVPLSFDLARHAIIPRRMSFSLAISAKSCHDWTNFVLKDF